MEYAMLRAGIDGSHGGLPQARAHCIALALLTGYAILLGLIRFVIFAITLLIVVLLVISSIVVLVVIFIPISRWS